MCVWWGQDDQTQLCWYTHTDRMAKEISLLPSNKAFSIVECVVLSFFFFFLASVSQGAQCLLPHNASVCVNISPSLSLGLQILTVPAHRLKNNEAVVGWEWCEEESKRTKRKPLLEFIS